MRITLSILLCLLSVCSALSQVLKTQPKDSLDLLIEQKGQQKIFQIGDLSDTIKVLIIDYSANPRHYSFTFSNSGKFGFFGPALEIGFQHDNGSNKVLNAQLTNGLAPLDPGFMYVTQINLQGTYYWRYKQEPPKYKSFSVGEGKHPLSGNPINYSLLYEAGTTKRTGSHFGIITDNWRSIGPETLNSFNTTSLILNVGMDWNSFFDTRFLINKNKNKVLVHSREHLLYVNMMYAIPIDVKDIENNSSFESGYTKFGMVAGYKYKHYKRSYNYEKKTNPIFFYFGLEGGLTPGATSYALLSNINIFSLRTGIGF